MKKYLALSIVTAILISCAFADRPLITDNFGVTDSGHYQLELSYNHDVPRDGTATYSLTNVRLKSGLMPNTDAWIEMPYYFGGYMGMGDAIIRAKWRFQKWSADEGLAARVDVKLTGGDQASMTTGFNDFAYLLICSKRFGPLLTHWNLGYTDIGEAAGATSANTIDYQAAVEYQIDDAKKVVAEIFGNSPQHTTSLNCQIGGTIKTAPNITIDGGYIFGLNNYSTDIVNIGCTLTY
ncbi:MAG: hypothetical protein QME05_06100 [Candidatus Margulisbacteria bacterium]|nr:hypothetical protein [Candidatus Margulisiibacteriota bacterium]